MFLLDLPQFVKNEMLDIGFAVTFIDVTFVSGSFKTQKCSTISKAVNNTKPKTFGLILKHIGLPRQQYIQDKRYDG